MIKATAVFVNNPDVTREAEGTTKLEAFQKMLKQLEGWTGVIRIEIPSSFGPNVVIEAPIPELLEMFGE